MPGLKELIIRRLAVLPITLLIVTLFVYIVVRSIPGNPVQALLGEQYSEEAARDLERQLGLDKPVLVGYVDWLSGVLRGDLGYSLAIAFRIRVADLLLQRIPVTIELASLSLLIGIVMGVGLGTLAGLNRGRKLDTAISALLLLNLAIPAFIRALILIFIFSIALRLLPSSGYVPITENPLENLKLMLMPSLAAGLGIASIIARITRASVINVIGSDYVTVAVAKGLPRAHILSGYVLRNALLPIITITGLQLGALIGGLVITEAIFRVPGVGSLVYESIIQRDYPVLLGTVLLISTSYIVVNLAVDILYAIADPRVRYGRGDVVG